ncbi:6619_t:CDS:2 [Funneliformis geosporum]|nr:6619_t:CDS:2 [Funneliformis geosporum]
MTTAARPTFDPARGYDNTTAAKWKKGNIAARARLGGLANFVRVANFCCVSQLCWASSTA